MERIALLAGQRQKSESSKAIQACNDYLRAGPGRTVAGLARRYQKSAEYSTPTRSLGTLNKWSQKYDWPERAKLYDAELERIKNERAEEILQSGLALAHERVQELKELSDFLKSQLYERGEEGVYHNVWLPDVKQIGSGPDAERVDIERFNAAIIDQYRGVLDDIAKEVGGRVVRQEVTGQTEVTVNFISNVDDDKL